MNRLAVKTICEHQHQWVTLGTFVESPPRFFCSLSSACDKDVKSLSKYFSLSETCGSVYKGILWTKWSISLGIVSVMLSDTWINNLSLSVAKQTVWEMAVTFKYKYFKGLFMTLSQVIESEQKMGKRCKKRSKLCPLKLSVNTEKCTNGSEEIDSLTLPGLFMTRQQQCSLHVFKPP